MSREHLDDNCLIEFEKEEILALDPDKRTSFGTESKT